MNGRLEPRLSAMQMIALFLAIASITAACENRRAEPAKPGTYLEAPVTQWRDLAGENRGELSGVLEQLQAAEGFTDAQRTEWIGGLVESLPRGDEWTLALGFAPPDAVAQRGFKPFLVIPGKEPLALSRTCLYTPSCVSCSNATTAPDDPPANPAKEFEGTCSTLSTAYSLVYILGVRSEFGDLGTVELREEIAEGGERVLRKYWKKGFLQTIREDQEHDPDSGTPRNKIKKAYERYACRCDGEVDIADTAGVDDWKRRLRDKLDDDPSPDCHFIIDGDDFAHDMHIDGIEDSGTLGVSDTGEQGSGAGDDIPVLVGAQEWSVEQGPSGPEIRCTKDANGSVDTWNRKKPKTASFICCSCSR